MAKVDGQPWYWGNADRETVSTALASQEDGSYVVRDASQPGSYTLHVRCKGITRMARIIGFSGKFGFVDTELHNSVDDLVNYHKTRSLNSFNPDMDACLLVGLPLPPPKRRTSSASSKKKPTPPPTREIPEIREGEKENRKKERGLEKRREKLPSPPAPQLRGAEASAANPHREIEFDLKLNMERLRISQTGLLRTERILTYYQIDYEKAMNLNHNYTKNIAEVTRKITELSDICENQRTNLKAGGLDDKVQESMTTNNQILSRSIDRLVAEKDMLVERRTRLQPIYDDLKENYERLRDKLETEIRRREKALAELMGLNRIDIYEMETIIEHLRMMSDKESIDQVAEMVNRPLEWDPESYLVFDHTKTYATKLIEEAKERAERQGKNSSGIFLIRPSATYPGLMVMDLLAENKICHFLIEQGSEGWGFKDTDTWFITIGDLVHFFTQESLGRYCKGLPAEIYLLEPAIQPKPW